jgi:predicted RNase H-like HicB family nuclease
MTYTAIYKLDTDGSHWLVHIDGIPGCHTYGRTREEARTRIREALALYVADADTAQISERDA